MTNPRLLLAVVAGLALAGCLDGEAPDAPLRSFIALQRDFAGFKSWSKFQVGDGDGPLPHGAGTRFAYVNKLPPHGSTAFPIGTIIVKTIESAAGEHELHAMVKRGDGFNAEGAAGWEWFELQLSTNDVPVIVWRGLTPPDGEGYGTLPGENGTEIRADCNACHAVSRANDFVQSAPLSLSTF